MRFLIVCFSFIIVTQVALAKGKTESRGQEVIEIDTPVKDLPKEVEEEPSVERDDDDLPLTTAGIQPHTKKESRKLSADTRRKIKDVDKIDGVKQEDEEAKIEKELSEIYKDTADYKADTETSSASVADTETSTSEYKPIQRARDSFVFQPDTNDKAAVERFRTSVDEISCDRSVTQRLTGETDQKLTKGASTFTLHVAVMIMFTVISLATFCC